MAHGERLEGEPWQRLTLPVSKGGCNAVSALAFLEAAGAGAQTASLSCDQALIFVQLLGQLYSLRCFVLLCFGDPGYCKTFASGQEEDSNSSVATTEHTERLAGFPREYIEIAFSKAAELDPGGFGMPPSRRSFSKRTAMEKTLA